MIAPASFLSKVGPGGRRNIRGLASNPVIPVQAAGRGGGQTGLRNTMASDKSSNFVVIKNKLSKDAQLCNLNYTPDQRAFNATTGSNSDSLKGGSANMPRGLKKVEP